jgi:hypothetical protein
VNERDHLEDLGIERNIKTDLKKIGCESVDYVNKVLNTLITS